MEEKKLNLSQNDINHFVWGKSTDKYNLLSYSGWVGDSTGCGICKFSISFQSLIYNYSILCNDFYSSNGFIDYKSLKLLSTKSL